LATFVKAEFPPLALEKLAKLLLPPGEFVPNVAPPPTVTA
jgi:hypothetical protein